jgi:hypothetical protein
MPDSPCRDRLQITINMITEEILRLAHGVKDFEHYRLRIMLAASGDRAYRG